MICNISNILDKSSKGWLKVYLNDFGYSYLCYKTKVKLLGNLVSNNQFRVLEGNFLNFTGRILNKSDSVYFEKFSPNFVAAKIVLDLDMSVLILENFGQFKVIVDKKMFKKKHYEILMPTHPHTAKLNPKYLDEHNGGTRFAETWFKIRPKDGYDENQYIHFGLFSEGCVTLTYKENRENGYLWNNIYLYLINCRENSHSLGTLHVITKK